MELDRGVGSGRQKLFSPYINTCLSDHTSLAASINYPIYNYHCVKRNRRAAFCSSRSPPSVRNDLVNLFDCTVVSTPAGVFTMHHPVNMSLFWAGGTARIILLALNSCSKK